MLQSVSLDTYKKCKKLADQHKIILQTHLAETVSEVEHSLKHYRKTPAKLLVENKIRDKNSLVAHVCHPTDDDIALLAKNKVNVSHCPVSNLKLVSGRMPLKKLLKAGVNISLGTDGACSNNNLDMFEEMKLAALVHKLAEKDPSAAEAQTILDMATINAAKAIGEEKNIGSIEKGKKADIVVIDFQQPHLSPCYNIVSNLVYSAKGSDVETAIINGRIVMENRKVLTANETHILKTIGERC
jgi:5-methylthioadenosine/S-adenosylhomocysteine deaminase